MCAANPQEWLEDTLHLKISRFDRASEHGMTVLARKLHSGFVSRITIPPLGVLLFECKALQENGTTLVLFQTVPI